MTAADTHAAVAALAEDVWNDFEGSPSITITHRDAESIARSVIDSPAMRDLLAEVAGAAAKEAEVRWMKVAVMRDGEAIREAAERAWDEGHQRGLRDADLEHEADNPYREEQP